MHLLTLLSPKIDPVADSDTQLELPDQSRLKSLSQHKQEMIRATRGVGLPHVSRIGDASRPGHGENPKPRLGFLTPAFVSVEFRTRRMTPGRRRRAVAGGVALIGIADD